MEEMNKRYAIVSDEYGIRQISVSENTSFEKIKQLEYFGLNPIPYRNIVVFRESFLNVAIRRKLLQEWCRENIKGHWGVEKTYIMHHSWGKDAATSTVFCFEKKEDAALFKLFCIN